MGPPRDIFTFFDPTTKIWRGLNTPPLYNPNQSLGAFLLGVMNRYPQQIAQINTDTGVRLTYDEIRLRTIRVAQNLSRMGYGKENVFTMAVYNDENAAPVLMACFTLGIPVNTLDASFKRDDLSHMLSTIPSQVVFCDHDTWPEMKVSLEMSKNDAVVFILGGEKVEGCQHVDELLVQTGGESQFVPEHFDDAATRTAIIICSSGTTGKSKGVCLSHSNCITGMSSFMQTYSTDVILYFSSLYWMSGLAFLLLGTTAGATRIITRDVYKPELALEIIEKFHVTMSFFPPPVALEILKHERAPHTDFSSIRILLSGGSAVSAELKYALEKMMKHASCYVSYGMSEIGGAVTISDENTYKGGSTGYLKPLVQAKIVDTNGKALDIGEEGEILIKSVYRFLGYYGNDAAKADTLDDDGWIHSGDIGRFDEDGFLYVIDRKKDIIKYRNYQISPSEIEAVIQTIPGVLNVCVSGIPVPGNDLPAALVVKSADTIVDADDIHKKVNGSLGTYKQLRGGVYFAEQLPMTPSGKVVRRQCKEILIERYNSARL